MKLNNKGVTLIEIITSIVLTSIILIFLMNLFVNVLGVYKNSKLNSEFEILNNNVVNSIGSDIIKYGLKSVRYVDNNDYSKIELVFNEYRETKIDENITKILEIRYHKNNQYIINYAYDKKSKQLTAKEKSSTLTRLIPENAILKMLDINGHNKPIIEIKKNVLTNNSSCYEIKIPMSDTHGNIYDINIYGII